MHRRGCRGCLPRLPGGQTFVPVGAGRRWRQWEVRTKTGWWVHVGGSSNAEVVGAEGSKESKETLASATKEMLASKETLAPMAKRWGTVGARTVSVESKEGGCGRPRKSVT